ncbi:MAG: hypothetical protein HOY78_36960 [Saccharothrix sp.]|nr:hypothetical protein [Saccharothrix sp.]
MGLGARLDDIRGEASGDGVSVTVDLHGKLVGLTFDRDAFTLRPDDLAGVVRRLAEAATADAVAQGMAVVTGVVPAWWWDDQRTSSSSTTR